MQTALSVRAVSSTSTTVASSNRSEENSSAARKIDSQTSTLARSSGSQGNVNIRLRIDGPHQRLREPIAVEPAIHGNHLAIQGFLQRSLHRPSKAEFNSALMRPGYDPSERLIVKDPKDKTVAGHVQVQSQTIRFGRSEIPVGRLRDFAMLPEFRHRGVDRKLLAEAETLAKRNGAMMMVARQEDYRFLKSNGWSVFGSDPVSIVSPQRLLGQLPAPAEPESPFYADKMPQWEVRMGRLTDVEALSSLYESSFSQSYGSVVRSLEDWSWLISKRAHDRVYQFIEDGQPLAYVVVRGASVLELVDQTDDGRGSARLLQHVGADAIDQGRYSVRLQCPLSSPAHAWADQAGGQLFTDAVQDCWMVKILSKRTLLRRLAHEMYRRKPKSLTELGIRIGNEELLIRNGVRSMKVTRGSSTKHQIGLTNRAAAQLFLGYRSVQDLAEHRELVASDAVALAAASELFPPVSMWRPLWNDMHVLD